MNRYHQWQKSYSGVTRKSDIVWKFPPKCIVNIAEFVEWAKTFLPTYKGEDSWLTSPNWRILKNRVSLHDRQENNKKDLSGDES